MQDRGQFYIFLTHVDDNIQSKTYVYQSDKDGNRVSEKIYNYTLSDSLGTVQKTIKSEYNYITWNDRLSKYDGKTITYDNAGNPIPYYFLWLDEDPLENISDKRVVEISE